MKCCLYNYIRSTLNAERSVSRKHRTVLDVADDCDCDVIVIAEQNSVNPTIYYPEGAKLRSNQLNLI